MVSSRPRILYLTPCQPNGRSSGSQLRVRQIGRALQDIGEVHFVVAGFNVAFENEDRAGEFLVDRSFTLQPVNRVMPWSRIRNALSARCINPYGFEVNEEGRVWLEAELPNFDLIWVHNLRTAGAFHRWIWPRSVIDVDDVPSMFLDSAACQGRDFGLRLRRAFQARVARRRERLLPRRFTVVSVCSEQDRLYLNLPGPVHVIPNGFELNGEGLAQRAADPSRIGFIGGLDYDPNADGIRWFVEQVWPRLKKDHPGLKLRIVGAQNEWLLNLRDPSIYALGYIRDAGEEMATWSAMIVPLRYGAGTRVKIAEGLGRKVPIVTTSLGCYGYDLDNGTEALIADTPNDFAKACLKVVENPRFAGEMAEKGHRRFQEQWTPEAIKPRVWAAAEECLGQTAVLPNAFPLAAR